MAGYIQVPTDGTGKKVDTVTLSDAGSEVHRQKLVITGGSGTAEVVAVVNVSASAAAMGLVTRPAGVTAVVGNVPAGTAVSGNPVIIAGQDGIAIQILKTDTTGRLQVAGAAAAAAAVEGNPVLMGGQDASLNVQTFLVNTAGEQAVVGTVVISGTATIAGRVVISTTATVAGVVGLTAGTANIGNLDFISRTVQVAIATPFTLQGISTTIQAAIATPYMLQGISTTVTVAGNINISATAPVSGTLNISGSVVVSGSVNIFTNAASNSASRGPRCVIASTSANVTLVSAPGAGLSIFVTHIAVSNASGANTRARIGSSATIGAVTMMLAQSAGGFVMNFVPPWELSANEHLLCSVKPNASEGIFNVHYFVGSSDAF